MECLSCGSYVVGFSVPDDLRVEIDRSDETIGICSQCLLLQDWTETRTRADFSRIIEGFPSGRAGVAMALSVGLLVDSVALHNEEVAALFRVVESEGVDPWLVLERLGATPTLDPPVDLDRARNQLDQLLT